jgi:hypothetical protein
MALTHSPNVCAWMHAHQYAPPPSTPIPLPSYDYASHVPQFLGER